MVFREQRMREAAEQYKVAALDNADLHVNYEEDNYDAEARSAIIDFTPKAFIAGIEWADEHPKNPWISVKDRLPKDRDHVFTAGGTCAYSILLYHDGRFYQSLQQGLYDGGVTYWMPIPELTFDDILDANKDVLKRIKENGD